MLITSERTAIQTGKCIDSPISVFNNLLNQFSKELADIYVGETKPNERIAFINKLLFENKSITIYGCIKIYIQDDNIFYKFLGKFDSLRLNIINQTIDNEVKIFRIFQQYLFLINSLTKNLDSSISQKYVESIYEEIINKDYSDKMFYIPYKNKIKHLYDSDDKILENLYNRFSYIARFKKISKHNISYKIVRVLSSELKESKVIENLRFEETEVIKEGNTNTFKFTEFLINLFYYGEIIN